MASEYSGLYRVVPPRVIFILGETASGKSSFAVQLAQWLGSCVISADAFQVYRVFGVASDKITPEEACGVPHYGIDLVEPHEEYTVRRFLEYAIPIIDAELGSGRSPIIVGGTNMYIDKLMFTSTLDDGDGSTDNPPIPTTTPTSHSELAIIDPVMASRLHPNDTRRIMKAIEYFHATGKRKSEALCEQTRQLRWPNSLFIRKTSTTSLPESIRSRVIEKMVFSDKLKSELLRLSFLIDSCQLHWGKGLLQAIGYREFEAYLSNPSDESQFEAGVEATIQDTLRYAKKQRTWLRRMEKLVVVHEVSGFNKDELVGIFACSGTVLKSTPTWLGNS
jgi:tRNA dimethylallyltransferase